MAHFSILSQFCSSKKIRGQGLQLVGSHSWWSAAGHGRSNDLGRLVSFVRLPGGDGRPEKVEETWKNDETYVKTLHIRLKIEEEVGKNIVEHTMKL